MAGTNAFGEPHGLLDRVTTRLAENHTAVIVLALATIAIIGHLDRVTGTQLSATVFYLVPVAVASWYIGRPAGRFMAVAAGVMQVTADLLADTGAPPVPIIVWNAAMIIVLSFVVGEVLTRLHASLDAERGLARTDALTGLANVRSFLELAQIELDRSRRYSRAFTVVSMDLDNFKSVNDSLGHATGDKLLSEVGLILRANLRRVDTVARLGGDEFSLLLPETDQEQAAIALSHVRIALRQLESEYGPAVQASVGAVTFATPPDTVADMLRLADATMYRAKAAGRNCVISVTVPTDPSHDETTDCGTAQA